jgi:hypothetical protein
MEKCLFGLTTNEVKRLAYQLAQRNRIQHSFNKANEKAGKYDSNVFFSGIPSFQ